MFKNIKYGFALTCSLHFLGMNVSKAEELGVGVNISGVPVLGEISSNETGSPQRVISNPLISFQYYHKVKAWTWGKINSHEEAREGWTTSKPFVYPQDGGVYNYRGKIGMFPYSMNLEQSSDGLIKVKYDVDLKCSPDAWKEKWVMRESSERGILIKILNKELVKDISYGKSASNLACSFTYKGKKYSLNIDKPHTVKKVSYPWMERKIRDKQTWACVDLGIGDPDNFSFSFNLTAENKLPVYLDYREFACKNDQSSWFDIPMDDSSLYMNVGNAVLDAPAGKYGFLITKGDKFYFENKEEPVFFSGTTYVHNSKFPEKELAETFAKRVAGLGFNIVRMHHLDYHIPGFAIWDRQEMKDGKTDNLDKELMDRMDYFIYCLKKEGIYVHMDGITARKYRENDGIEDYDKLTFGMKGTAYLHENEVLMNKQKDFFKKLWNHYNPYTKLAYKDDPAIVTTVVNNETDLYTHGNLNHHFPKAYKATYMDMWNKWAADNDLVNNYPQKYSRLQPHKLFKRDTMETYYNEIRDYLHTMNAKRPVCGTTWLYDDKTLALHASYDKMDYTADHPYRSGLYESDELNLFLKGPKHFSYMNIGKRFDKPFVHEEWSSGGFDRTFSTALPVALMTAVDHDMSIQFAMYHGYKAGRKGKDVLSLNMAMDPARVFMFPALNLMFIRRDLKKNPDQYVYMLTDEVLFGKGPNSLARKKFKDIYPSYDVAAFHGRVSFAFTEKNVDDILFDNPDAQIIYPGQSPKGLPTADQYPIVSGTGELELYWKERFFLTKAGRTKMAMGYIGKSGEKNLGDGVSVQVAGVDYACTAITSLNDKDIVKSDHLMITAIANVELKGMFYNSEWKKPIAPSTDVVAEPVRGYVTIPTTMKNPVVTWRTPDNKVGGTVPVMKDGNKIIIPLSKSSLVYEVKESVDGE